MRVMRHDNNCMQYVILYWILTLRKKRKREREVGELGKEKEGEREGGRSLDYDHCHKFLIL